MAPGVPPQTCLRSARWRDTHALLVGQISCGSRRMLLTEDSWPIQQDAVVSKNTNEPLVRALRSSTAMVLCARECCGWGPNYNSGAPMLDFVRLMLRCPDASLSILIFCYPRATSERGEHEIHIRRGKRWTSFRAEQQARTGGRKTCRRRTLRPRNFLQQPKTPTRFQAWLA